MNDLNRKIAWVWMSVWVLGSAGSVLSGSGSVLAMGSAAPDTKIDCRKKKNEKKKECRKKGAQNSAAPLSDDEHYQAGYWLARQGKFRDALMQFRQAKNQNDPRILNYIGYATRKLGRVDEAMGYYAKVLTIDPNFTLARAYLGEAFLQQGKISGAKDQLVEIGRRCGQSCPEYVVLAKQIESYSATRKYDEQDKLSRQLSKETQG